MGAFLLSPILNRIKDTKKRILKQLFLILCSSLDSYVLNNSNFLHFFLAG